MVGASKILTVSYGTFSCTLEGFEDSFETMKAIAEYFRDLAADDRYFGAEPPQPDAEMLARIAEKEIKARVEARMQDNNVVLRAHADQPAPGIAAPAEPPVPEVAPEAAAPAPVAGTSAPVAEDDVTDVEEAALFPAGDAPESESVAARLQRIRAVVSRARAAETGLAGAAAAETIEDAEVSGQTGRPVSETAPEAAPETARETAPEPVGEDTEGAEGGERKSAAENAIEIPLAVDAGDEARETEAEHTDRTTAEDAAEDTPLSEDAAEEPASETFEESLEDEEATEEFGTEGFATDISTDDEAVEDDELAMELAELEQAAAAPEEDDRAIGAPEETGAISAERNVEEIPAPESGEPADLADEAAAAEGAVEAETEEPGSAENAPHAALEEGPSETEEEAAADRPDLLVLGMPAAGTAAETGDRPAADLHEEHEEDENVFAETVGDTAGDTADNTEELTEKARDTDEPDVLKLGEALAEEASERDEGETLFADEPLFEDVAIDEAEAEGENVFDDDDDIPAEELIRSLKETLGVEGDIEDDEEGAALSDAPEERLSEDVSDPAAEYAEIDDDAPHHGEERDHIRRTLLENEEVDEEADRILDETNQQFEAPENTRRRSAISHLRAAVAATVAERLLKGSKPKAGQNDEEAEAEAYREDLSKVIRPSRPKRRSEKGSSRPARQAPLVLVSEQRIEEDDSAAEEAASVRPVAPVRPRRVRRKDPAAQDVTPPAPGENGSEMHPQADEQKVLEESTSFSDFARRVGATELPDLLEAAAAYTAYVEGQPHFSRPDILRRVQQSEISAEFDREDQLRYFGQLLREGKIVKIRRGQFMVSETTRFKPQSRIAGE